MTKNGVLRKASGHGTLEGIHIVNAFADKRAFAENILIHVGHFPRVRINARIAGKQPDKPRTSGAGQTHADARLENAVAFANNPTRVVEHRTVRRMGHRADELTRGFAWQ